MFRPIRPLLIIATSVAAAALGGCGGSPAPAVTVTQAAPTVTEAAPTVTVSEAPEPATPEETAEPAAVEPETFTMPKVIGKNLQLAQDILQKEGSFLMDQRDALGLDRFQINDSNWKVCSQKPKAGKEVPIETIVVLAAVKLDEDCP